MDLHGYPWTYMDIHGLTWISMDLHGYPWTFHGLSINMTWTFYGLSMDFPWTFSEVIYIFHVYLETYVLLCNKLF